MGITYFKLNQVDKAILYLNKIHENESIAKNQSYSYLSACYYLYSISKDNKYLDTIVRVARKDKNLSSNSKDTCRYLCDFERL